MLWSISLCPLAIHRSTVPIATVKAEVPQRTLTGWLGIGEKDLKSEYEGEMWQVAPVSRMNGELPDLLDRHVYATQSSDVSGRPSSLASNALYSIMSASLKS